MSGGLPGSCHRKGTVFVVPDFADDPVTEAERMAKALKVMALVETVSYLVLFYFSLTHRTTTPARLVGTVSGIIWLSFVSDGRVAQAQDPVVVALRDLLVVVTGPIGGVLSVPRLQTEGVPDQYPSARR